MPSISTTIISIISVIVILLLFAIGIQYFQIKHLDSKIVTMQADNTTLTNNNQSLVASLNSQNAAVASLQAESSAKQKHSALLLAQAVKDAKKYQDRYKILSSQKMTKDDCQNMKNTVDLYFTKASQ